jgi:hypothetical protein
MKIERFEDKATNREPGTFQPHPVFGFRVQRFRVQRLTVEPAEP